MPELAPHVFVPLPSKTITAKDFFLHSYLLRITPSLCTRCGAKSEASEVFAVYTHPLLTPGSAARQLIPARELNPDLPIGITTLNPREQPLCPLCVGTIPSPDPRPTLSDSRWAQALAGEARKKAAATPKPAAKFDDLSDI